MLVEHNKIEEHVKTAGDNQGHQKLPVRLCCLNFSTKTEDFSQLHNEAGGLSLYSTIGRSGRLVCVTEEALTTKFII